MDIEGGHTGIIGAIVAFFAGGWALVRWVFIERSQVLQQQESAMRNWASLNAELGAAMKAQASEIQKMRESIAGLEKLVDIERAARREAEDELDRMKDQLERVEKHNRALIRVCKSCGVEVPSNV